MASNQPKIVVNNSGGTMAEDIRMIVGELKGEFKSVIKKVDMIAVEVQGLRDDHNKRKGATRIIIGLSIVIGNFCAIVVQKVAGLL